MFIIAVLILLGTIGSALHITYNRKNICANKVYSILFCYFTVICFGGLGMWGFMGHVFAADLVAQKIGWPVGNPFQTEVGIANLAIGVVSILVIWIRGNYWIASTLINSIFLIGAGILHIKEIFTEKNFSIGNTSILISDIGLPVLITVLLLLFYRTTENKEQTPNT